MISYLQNVDMKMLNLINKNLRYTILDRIMPMISTLGNGGTVWLAFSIYLIINQNHRIEAYMIITSLILTTIIGEGIIKHIIKRTRPFVNMMENNLLISKPITYSFPSGHTASSFAAVGISISMGNRLSVFLLILAALIAFSRIYLNVHYPTDVFTGVILGLLCAKFVIVLFNSDAISCLNFVHQL